MRLTILDYKTNFNPDSSPDKLHERVAQRISEVCIKNEGLYIKLGQSIAIQAAILPTLYKKLFKKMFDSSNPLPFEDVLKVWNAEFPGSSLNPYFDFFDKIPVACGSIAQVHRAKLKNSDQVVAVKIQRPDIPIQMELDLFAYRTILYVYQNVFELLVYFIAHYVSDQIRKETDFINEARNSERTATLIAEDSLLKDKIYVPKVYWPLTTTRILTTEYVESGSRLTDVDSLESQGFTKKEVMDTAMKLFTQMLFTFGWLHCDLHPGNILVFEHKSKLKLGSIDHGLYIHLPNQFRRDYCLFVLDTDSIERIAQGWGIVNSDLFASATSLWPFKARAPSGQDGPLRGTSNSGYEILMLINELIFIVRCMRMMQGNNQVLGSPTNQINILALKWSRRWNDDQCPTAIITSIGGRWVEGIVKLWKFRTILILVDIGFFFTQVKHSIDDHQLYMSDSGGSLNQEGFEDILQRQLENLAKEEFGVALDDSAFMG
ncbi:Atypical/ABC1 protein kinase [Puccinia striiformis f. sp. tritici PST-78]|uniref:Atypical/ABC1 protein kinase n=1 Tax=Puccinia striiformis f. sp. tritici PST-78 TaxID=1165861 RepID=A0A0L0VV75_9BASI|nr:Atypical/ABC1 protein kinase [Puccinia striiformis f. sp. tritici PST-78]